MHSYTDSCAKTLLYKTNDRQAAQSLLWTGLGKNRRSQQNAESTGCCIASFTSTRSHMATHGTLLKALINNACPTVAPRVQWPPRCVAMSKFNTHATCTHNRNFRDTAILRPHLTNYRLIMGCCCLHLQFLRCAEVRVVDMCSVPFASTQRSVTSSMPGESG